MTSTNNDFNPFEDPSVRNLTNSSSANQDNFGTYNPFEKPDKQSKETTAASSHSTISPTKMEKEDSPPPAYENSGAQKAIQTDLERRQEELERKANELQAREAKLAASSPTVSNKNWPPLPAKCCVGPCFYQDITVEIPDAYQRTVRVMYYLWIFYAILLLFNMLGALALFIANGEGTTFGLSLLVLVLFSPLSFVCWFRPLYKAFRSDSSFNFMIFFFIFFFQFAIAVVYAVGIPRMGSCGLLNGITTLGQSGNNTVSTNAVGIIAILIGFLWAAYAMISFFMLVKIHKMYRGTTASFAKAQEELASGVMRNQHVQNAAATAVTQTVQQGFNTRASGLRY